jgi:hypothetical protein
MARFQAAFWTAIVCFVTLSGLACDSDGSKDSERLEVTEAEVANARAALTADPTFASLTKGRQWEVTAEEANIFEEKKVGVGLIVELAEPVDSDGPWKQVRCRGTVSEEYRFLYKGVSTLGTGFDQGGKRLVSIQPLPSATMSFDEGDVARQPTQKPCPRGSEDEEN